MTNKSEWTDKCDSIKEGSSRYDSMVEKVNQSGCATQNQTLTKCLSLFKKDWRMCQKETDDLKKCMSSQSSALVEK